MGLGLTADGTFSVVDAKIRDAATQDHTETPKHWVRRTRRPGSPTPFIFVVAGGHQALPSVEAHCEQRATEVRAPHASVQPANKPAGRV